MTIRKTILLIIILLLVGGNVFLGVKYFVIQRELEAARTEIKTQQINEKTLEFTKLFIEKVLKAETEVDFETRLKLENAVRNLEDKEILAQWQKFVESQTEIEAQKATTDLLELLVSKIR